MSVDHVLDIAKTITTIKIRMPENGAFFTKTLFLTDKHRTIMSLSYQKTNFNLGGALMKSESVDFLILVLEISPKYLP